MKIHIIYWSGTGNTEAMAKYIQEGAAGEGADIVCKEVSAADVSDVACDILCLGCPSMGDEVLEEAAFEPFIASIEGSVQGKRLALFGSYGWGDGQWMRDWEVRMQSAGATLAAESLMVNEAPSGDECKAFGASLAK